MRLITSLNTLSIIAVAVGLSLAGFGQNPLQAQEESTTLKQGTKVVAPENGVEKTEIVLDRRSANEYGKSAYSFRYKTQSKAKHKNYVDVVYSANGDLRINNHGGLKSTIADLGDKAGSGFDIGKVAKADWQTRRIKPVAKHYFVQTIDADKNKMKVVFHVDSVTEEKVKLTAWYEKGKHAWPVPLDRRGAAGTSGMSRRPSISTSR